MPWFAIGIVISKRIYIGQTKVLDKNSEYTDFFLLVLKKQTFFERQTQDFFSIIKIYLSPKSLISVYE